MHLPELHRYLCYGLVLQVVDGLVHCPGHLKGDYIRNCYNHKEQ